MSRAALSGELDQGLFDMEGEGKTWENAGLGKKEWGARRARRSD